MSLEIEKKYRLPAERRVEVMSELESLHAVFDSEDFEENIIFGGGGLPAGSIVRIRKTQRRTLLTFKRRIEDVSDVKQQIEHETEVSNGAAVEQIILELGLVPRLVYEKRRLTWQLGDAEVVIDELPFGLFMEIEGSRTAIRAAEMSLGIEDLETEAETYPQLTARHGRKVGQVIEARFS